MSDLPCGVVRFSVGYCDYSDVPSLLYSTRTVRVQYFQMYTCAIVRVTRIAGVRRQLFHLKHP